MRKYNPMKIAGLLAAGAIWMGASISAMASINMTVYDDGSDLTRSAVATFQSSGSQLTITLLNDYTGTTIDTAHLLTGLFFSGLGNLVLQSATATAEWNLAGATPVQLPGSSFAVKAPPLAGGWTYGTGVLPHGATAGISTAGLGVFGALVDGQDFGMLSAGFGLNSPILDGLSNKQKQPLLQGLTTFVFSGYVDGATPLNISFQYGTALNEPNIAVPEPTTMIAGALLLLPFGASTLRILRRNRQS